MSIKLSTYLSIQSPNLNSAILGEFLRGELLLIPQSPAHMALSRRSLPA